jgi:large subunit ribosomal protein L21
LPSKLFIEKIVKLLEKSGVRNGILNIQLTEMPLAVENFLKKIKMYAIVDIAGQQFKVEKERKLYVHRLKAEEGATITFDKVLLVDNEGTVKVGAPYIDGASVTAKVLTHLKGEKVIVFKKKRRKGYQKKNGHRQYLTQIQIENIA